MFDWKLDNSAAAARCILADNVGKDLVLAHWQRNMCVYRERKAALLTALCPETGRRTIPLTYDPSPSERAALYRSALRYNAVHAATAALHEAELTHIEHANARSAAALKRRREQINLLAEYGAALFGFADMVSMSSLGAGAIDKTNDALLMQSCPSLRHGQTISRALASYLRSQECSADNAALLVDAVTSAAQGKAKSGVLTLTANPLDIVLMSESCAWTSCHSLDGCHAAGPQQYLYDEHTLLATYHEEERPAHGHTLPYKLWRQVVYVDSANRAAALQREYGKLPGDSAALTARREVARLLLRLNGQIDLEPRWKIATDRSDASISGASMAYLDSTREYVSLDGERPRIRLSRSVPCPECGETLDRENKLVCSACLSAHSCDDCGRSLREDDSYPSPSGEEVYCSDCYHDHFTDCHSCDRTIYNDSAIDVYGHDYCERCADRYYPVCECCDLRSNADDMRAGRCPTCFHVHPVCSGCSKEYDPAAAPDMPETAALPVPGADDDATCPVCIQRQYRRLLMLRRLSRSPRMLRLHIWCALYEQTSDDALTLLYRYCDTSRSDLSHSYAVSAYRLALEYIP
jgi:hypothetical protein